MLKNTTRIKQLNKIVILILTFIFCLSVFAGYEVNAATTTINPEDSQYLELRAVDVRDVAGQNKQVIMELWSHDLNFKGFDVVFSFDDTKFKTSNMTTNVITNDISDSFEFENEFDGKLNIFQMDRANSDELELVVSLKTVINSETEHIKQTGSNGDGNPTYSVITDDEDVLLGKISFQMTADEFSINSFALVTNEYSPTTGIKIDINLTQNFQAQSTFRFTDETASRNANLSNLVVSNGEVDELDPTNSTYKEYTLTPTFDKTEIKYEITLDEYIDKVDIKAVLEDDTATMVIKYPKRDANDELVYVSNVLQYDQENLDDNTKVEIPINKLGEPDTEIIVFVTAEDGTTTKDYTVTIKRPYATLKGRNILSDFDNEISVTNIQDTYGITISNSASVNLYTAGVAKWEEIPDIYNPSAFTYDDLSAIPILYSEESNDDGTYEMYIIPGLYDVQITRLSYLDYIYKNVMVNEGDVIDMGSFYMPAGDANRDGVISQEDVTTTKSVIDNDNSMPDWEDNWNPTQVGTVIAEDLAYVKQNQDLELTILEF